MLFFIDFTINGIQINTNIIKDTKTPFIGLFVTRQWPLPHLTEPLKITAFITSFAVPIKIRGSYFISYLLAFTLAVFFESLWEVLERLLAEIELVFLYNKVKSFGVFDDSYFDEHPFDVVGDIFQSMVGSVVMLLAIRIMGFKPVSYCMWARKWKLNVLYFALLICAISTTFIGVFIKVLDSSHFLCAIFGSINEYCYLNVGFWIWPFIQSLFFLLMMYIDVFLTSYDGDYPNKKERILFYIYIICAMVIYHIFSLDLRIYVYFSTWGSSIIFLLVCYLISCVNNFKKFTK